MFIAAQHVVDTSLGLVEQDGVMHGRLRGADAGDALHAVRLVQGVVDLLQGLGGRGRGVG